MIRTALAPGLASMVPSPSRRRWASASSGAAGAIFVLGRSIAPGIHGAMPSLTALQGGGSGSLVHGTDFKNVYSAAVEHWLGVDPRLVIGDVKSADCIRPDHR